MVKLKEKVFIIIIMEIFMKANLKIGVKMDMVFIILSMEIDMKEILKLDYLIKKVGIFIKMKNNKFYMKHF